MCRPTTVGPREATALPGHTRRRPLRLVTYLLPLIVAGALRPSATHAQPPLVPNPVDSHVVSVVVLDRTDLVVVGGDLVLVLTAPLVGGNPPPVTDATSCDLLWAQNANNRRRITVQSDLVAPRYTLTVEARNIQASRGTPGVSAGVVTLTGGTAYDFITDVRRTAARCDLAYTASATLAAGFGTEVHTVTYTLTNR